MDRGPTTAVYVRTAVVSVSGYQYSSTTAARGLTADTRRGPRYRRDGERAHDDLQRCTFCGTGAAMMAKKQERRGEGQQQHQHTAAVAQHTSKYSGSTTTPVYRRRHPRVDAKRVQRTPPLNASWRMGDPLGSARQGCSRFPRARKASNVPFLSTPGNLERWWYLYLVRELSLLLLL